MKKVFQEYNSSSAAAAAHTKKNFRRFFRSPWGCRYITFLGIAILRLPRLFSERPQVRIDTWILTLLLHRLFICPNIAQLAWGEREILEDSSLRWRAKSKGSKCAPTLVHLRPFYLLITTHTLVYTPCTYTRVVLNPCWCVRSIAAVIDQNQ